MRLALLRAWGTTRLQARFSPGLSFGAFMPDANDASSNGPHGASDLPAVHVGFLQSRNARQGRFFWGIAQAKALSPKSSRTGANDCARWTKTRSGTCRPRRSPNKTSINCSSMGILNRPVLLHGAIEEFSQEFASVIRRFFAHQGLDRHGADRDRRRNAQQPHRRTRHRTDERFF